MIEDELVPQESDDLPLSRSERQPVSKGETTPAFNVPAPAVNPEPSKPKQSEIQQPKSNHLSPPIRPKGKGQGLGAFDLTEESKVTTQDARPDKSDGEDTGSEPR